MGGTHNWAVTEACPCFVSGIFEETDETQTEILQTRSM